MPKFLIDVNLSSRFAFWQGSDFIYQKDIGQEWKDNQIWDYAKANNLSIVSKDSDFSVRILSLNPPPKIIYIRLGNMKMKPFQERMEKCWSRRGAAE